MDTRSIREINGLTVKQFAKKYDIPVRTIEGWDYKDTLPIYFYNILLNCEKQEKNRVSI